MPLPYQGRIGILDLASPTLIPNFYSGVQGNHTLDYQSPAQYVVNNPRIAAAVTATAGGSVTAGNTITATVTQAQLHGGAVTATYVTVSGDTIDTVISGIASALNDMLYGVADAFVTTNESALTLNWKGPCGNFATLAISSNGTETFTLNPVGGGLTGGSGPVVCANNFNFQYNGSTMSFYYGKVYSMDNDLLSVLVSQDQPVM